jgi:hypothetical protein
MKSKRTEEVAKWVVGEYVKNKDLIRFVVDVSEYSSLFGRYNRNARVCFLEALKKEIREKILNQGGV